MTAETGRGSGHVIERAIFVIEGAESGRRFLAVLPDLRRLGLSKLTVVHLLPGRGPADPMPDLAQWIRSFESVVPEVELRLKRGDPARWISELARVRRAQLVVLAEEFTRAWIRYFERVSSPLRTLGRPILLLPNRALPGPLFDRVVLAVKSPATLEQVAPTLLRNLHLQTLTAVRVLPTHETSSTQEAAEELAGTRLITVPPADDLASTLLALTARENGTLLVILAEERAADSPPHDASVVGRTLLDAHLPIFIWPEPNA